MSVSHRDQDSEEGFKIESTLFDEGLYREYCLELVKVLREIHGLSKIDSLTCKASSVYGSLEKIHEMTRPYDDTERRD